MDGHKRYMFTYSSYDGEDYNVGTVYNFPIKGEYPSYEEVMELTEKLREENDHASLAVIGWFPVSD